METIDGIEIYPLVSFLIFFTFFIGLFAYVLLLRRGYVQELENLPFNEND
jgi:cytochrome c oxidase cbb3-type subunit 4